MPELEPRPDHAADIGSWHKRRMGWSFPWASSFGSDYDFQAAHTKEQQQSGVVEYNFRAMDMRPALEAGKESLWLAEIASGIERRPYAKDHPMLVVR